LLRFAPNQTEFVVGVLFWVLRLDLGYGQRGPYVPVRGSSPRRYFPL